MSGESQASATWAGPDEGEQLWFIGTLATIKVPGEAVENRFALIEFVFPLHTSPPLHTHPQDETMIVLEGQLTVCAGDRVFELERGAAGAIPMGVPHSFVVNSDMARVLVLSTPAGIERFVRAGGTPARAPTLPPADAVRPSPEELARVFSDHEVITLGPPLLAE